MSGTMTEVQEQPLVDGQKPEVAAESLATASPAVFFQVTLRVSNGRCILERDGKPMGKNDFVGLYDNSAISDPWGSKGWNWCTNTNFPYATGVNAQVGFVAQYYAYDFRTGQYVRLAVTPPLTQDIIASNGSVSGRTTC